jgi:hypothetical protein
MNNNKNNNDDDDDNYCPICYDQKSDYFTECNHKYCIDCLKRLTKCAMCNKILNRSLICQQIRNKFHNENRSDMSDIYIIYYSFIMSRMNEF